MQSIVNLAVIIFLGIVVWFGFVTIVLCLFMGITYEQVDAKLFGVGGIVGIITVLSAIVIYLMKTRGLI